MAILIQNEGYAISQFRGIQHHGVLCNAHGTMFVHRLDDCRKYIPVAWLGRMKDPPGWRGDEGLIQENFYTVFILRQGQRFGIRAGEGKAEHLESFCDEPFTVLDSGKSFAPVKNNMIGGVEAIKVAGDIVVRNRNKNHGMTQINQRMTKLRGQMDHFVFFILRPVRINTVK